MVGGTNGGICHGLLNLIFIFHLVRLCFESGIAPGAYKWTSTEVFFMPEIQKLSTFLG